MEMQIRKIIEEITVKVFRACSYVIDEEKYVQKILDLSPWKKFDGIIEELPILIGWDISNVTVYVEDEDELNDLFSDGDYENAYYMEIPKLPSQNI